jgi:hypothetical protein
MPHTHETFISLLENRNYIISVVNHAAIIATTATAAAKI